MRRSLYILGSEIVSLLPSPGQVSIQAASRKGEYHRAFQLQPSTSGIKTSVDPISFPFPSEYVNCLQVSHGPTVHRSSHSISVRAGEQQQREQQFVVAMLNCEWTRSRPAFRRGDGYSQSSERDSGARPRHPPGRDCLAYFTAVLHLHCRKEHAYDSHHGYFQGITDKQQRDQPSSYSHNCRQSLHSICLASRRILGCRPARSVLRVDSRLRRRMAVMALFMRWLRRSSLRWWILREKFVSGQAGVVMSDMPL
ncbi:hypothetical protein N657DRAFT_228013 [Parathielavia appendiculata]|uniref:Uncharacterized protein n=1 Tax=Parathielavia appendiculata TaxID=2587402 RepID=A0AAN6Z7T6_9PEZI|nr:hypothetical protein N657DRAFT_228013 [Parathielavia appendiculata]